MSTAMHNIDRQRLSEILDDAVPRIRAFVSSLRGNASQWANDFLEQAEQFSIDPDGYEGPISPEWTEETLYPFILNCESIFAKRAEEAAISNYVGSVDDARVFEATVTFTTTFENQFGERHLTIMKDDGGNVLKYWNKVNILDPIEQQINPTGEKRAAKAGDKVQFRATIKAHETYKGVKGTVLARARKAILIHSAA